MSLPVYVPPPRQSRRERFAAWRHTRPFWGGLWAIVAGVYLWSLTAAPVGVVVIQGVAGISSIVICLVCVIVALAVWAQPQIRVIGGGIVIVLGLAAILLTNLGGFLVGTLMALHGGASMIAWKPVVKRWTRPEPQTVPALATSGAVSELVGRMGPDGGAPAADPAHDTVDLTDDLAADLGADPTDPTDDVTDRPADDGTAPVGADTADETADPADPADTADTADTADAADDVPAVRPTAPRPGGMAAGMTILPSSAPAPSTPSTPSDPDGPPAPAGPASASSTSVIR